MIDMKAHSMPTEPQSEKIDSSSKKIKEDDLSEYYLNELTKLANDRLSLDQIFAQSEKLVQYCRLKNPDGAEKLRSRLAAKQQAIADQVAEGVNSPNLKRLQAALAGAEAGFVYPLGWSPRDLNLMVF